ncbi:MAG TPA: hypothetical protein VJ835_02735 [Fimbriimonadaceae bacterium]|nr:hypothetical protein [Fimbriimonadaceae bacterium]
MIQVRQEGAFDGPENMRRDLDLASTSHIAARVYSWNGPWVSLGKNQTVDSQLISSGVPYVQRPTGGAAVLHGHDATVGLVVPVRYLESGLGSTFRNVTKPLVEALRACGLPAVLAANVPGAYGGEQKFDCFVSVSKTDVVHEITRAKICGCALLRTREFVLLQASIPNGEPLIDPAKVFTEPANYSGPLWNDAELASELESALRYNFVNV